MMVSLDDDKRFAIDLDDASGLYFIKIQHNVLLIILLMRSGK